MHGRLLLGALAVIACALGATGCGGDESTAKAKPSFVQQANAACDQFHTDWTKDVKAIARAVKRREIGTEEARHRVFEALRQDLRRAAVALAAIEPPAELKTTYDRFTQLRTRSVTLQVTPAEAEAEHDPNAKVRAATERQAAKLARRMRLAACV